MSNDATAQRIEALKAKLARRENMPEYAQNVRELREEIAKLEAKG